MKNKPTDEPPLVYYVVIVLLSFLLMLIIHATRPQAINCPDAPFLPATAQREKM